MGMESGPGERNTPEPIQIIWSVTSAEPSDPKWALITASDLVQDMAAVRHSHGHISPENRWPPARAYANRPPPMLDRQRLARLHVRDDLVDLGAVERALDAQHVGQAPCNPPKLCPVCA